MNGFKIGEVVVIQVHAETKEEAGIATIDCYETKGEKDMAIPLFTAI